MLTSTRSLNGRQIIAWWECHGGPRAVHVRPYGDGWANTLVCVDGSKLRTTADQADAVLRELERMEASA